MQANKWGIFTQFIITFGLQAYCKVLLYRIKPTAPQRCAVVAERWVEC